MCWPIGRFALRTAQLTLITTVNNVLLFTKREIKEIDLTMNFINFNNWCMNHVRHLVQVHRHEYESTTTCF